MAHDRHEDARSDCDSRFDCGNYEVSSEPLSDAEIWERTPPKRRHLLPPDFAERFGGSQNLD
ncbi:hypothetical protein [Leisingera sp. F5]|uniref:hypothetical protein n=1 Tax=Leisingera sp. F5 TaxID=1813816 RepID=UPI000A61B7E1|nr:hypothetical protein [Leisingera sp. F5]